MYFKLLALKFDCRNKITQINIIDLGLQDKVTF